MGRFTIVLALILVGAACGNDSAATTTAPTITTAGITTTAATTTTAAATTTTVDTGGQPLGPLVRLQAIFFPEQHVVIKNFGDEPRDLTGYWLCQRPSYTELPAVTLQPGESLLLSLGTAPPDDLPEGQQSARVGNLGGLSADNGEVALYRSRDFGNADDIISYVEWGSPDHGRSSLAVAAGIWPTGGFVTTTSGSVGLFTLTGFANPDDWVAR